MTTDEALSIVADAAGCWAQEIREYITDIDDSRADEIDEALELVRLVKVPEPALPWGPDPLHEQIGDDPRGSFNPAEPTGDGPRHWTAGAD